MSDNLHQIQEAAERVSGLKGPFPVKNEAGDYFEIEAGDILALNGEYFLVRGFTSEQRFGLEGEPKFWVKRAQKLPSGQRIILKLAFEESFQAKIGPLTFPCYRSASKESRILKKVAGHPGFMHGYSASDIAGNNIRVLEIVPGPSLDVAVLRLEADHETYFRKLFPDFFAKFIQAVEDLRDLHAMGEIHGDVRRDHLILDRESGRLRWIDFDYTFDYGQANRYSYDLFGLGRVILFLVGQGDWTLHRMRQEGRRQVLDRLTYEDMNIVFKNMLANLKMLFPYIPERLNRICLSFSLRANRFYENTHELLDDLHRVAAQL